MNISVFCGAAMPENKHFVEAAREVGEIIAKEGHTLLYGGSNLGLMGIVSQAVLDAKGIVFGVIPTFFPDEIIFSQRVTELFRVKTIADRKTFMMDNSDVFLALPGGIGTLDELLEVMVANQLNRISKPVGLLNIDGFFNPLIDMMRHMQYEGLFKLDKANYLHIAATPGELMRMLAVG